MPGGAAGVGADAGQVALRVAVGAAPAALAARRPAHR